MNNSNCLENMNYSGHFFYFGEYYVDYFGWETLTLNSCKQTPSREQMTLLRVYVKRCSGPQVAFKTVGNVRLLLKLIRNVNKPITTRFHCDCVTLDGRTFPFSQIGVVLQVKQLFHCFAKRYRKPPDKQEAVLSHPLKLFIAYLLSPAVGGVLPAILSARSIRLF